MSTSPSHSPRPIADYVLNTRSGLFLLLVTIAALNALEVRLEDWFGHGSYETGYLIARTLRRWEFGISFSGQEQVSDSAVWLYSVLYFIVFPLLLVLTAVRLAWRRATLAEFRSYALAVTVCFATALVFYVFVPVPERWAVPQTAAVLLSDRISTQLIRWMRPMSGLDNCFPSMHVALSVIVVFFAYRCRFGLRHSIAFLAAGIVASTFVLGIHWLPDIVAGLSAGLGASAAGILINGALERSGWAVAVAPVAVTASVAVKPIPVPPDVPIAALSHPLVPDVAFVVPRAPAPPPAPARPTASPPPVATPSPAARIRIPEAGVPSTPLRGIAKPQEGDIFISYSSNNREHAMEIVRILTEYGYLIWLDKMAIHAGAYFADKVVKALKRAKVVLVIVSRESLASQNVKTEVHLARQHEKNVLPILLGFSTEEVQTAIPDDWSYLLGISQSVEYSAVLEDHATLVDALAELEVFPQLPRPATAADKNTINAHERFAPERDAGEGSSGTPWPDGAIVGDVPPSATQVPFPMAAPQNQPPPGPTTPA